MVDRDDIGKLLNAAQNLSSFAQSSQLLARYVLDRLRFHRGTRLVMGNALVGRLYSSLRKRGLLVDTGTNVTGLTKENNKVIGVEIKNNRQIGRASCRERV